MTQAYEGEKRAIMRHEKMENNLMTSLVRASQANVDQRGSTTGSHQEGLTEDEVYGNVFVFNFAGQDATAICLLATRPNIQDWIAEEINAVLAGVASQESSYEAAFPRLPRRLAVVVSDLLVSCIERIRHPRQFETVRLYTAVAIAKSTGPDPRPLKLGSDNVLIPKNTFIMANYSALHTHPHYWGNDALELEALAMDHPRITHLHDQRFPIIIITPIGALNEPPTHDSRFVAWSGVARC